MNRPAVISPRRFRPAALHRPTLEAAGSEIAGDQCDGGASRSGKQGRAQTRYPPADGHAGRIAESRPPAPGLSQQTMDHQSIADAHRHSSAHRPTSSREGPIPARRRLTNLFQENEMPLLLEQSILETADVTRREIRQLLPKFGMAISAACKQERKVDRTDLSRGRVVRINRRSLDQRDPQRLGADIEHNQRQ